MKNLLIYVSPKKEFEKKYQTLMQIQIENSLSLVWAKNDLLVITNFHYECPVPTYIINDYSFCSSSPISTKTTAIDALFKNNFFSNELYWAHDLDAFQLIPISEDELGMDDVDVALTDYGRRPRWSCGSIFFKKSAQDIFERTRNIIYKDNLDEEFAIWKLTNADEKVQKRIKKLNSSYNFMPFNLRNNYKFAIKPLRVAHFDLFGGVPQLRVESGYDFYKGNNKISTPLITKELVNIIDKYENN